MLPLRCITTGVARLCCHSSTSLQEWQDCVATAVHHYRSGKTVFCELQAWQDGVATAENHNRRGYTVLSLQRITTGVSRWSCHCRGSLQAWLDGVATAEDHYRRGYTVLPLQCITRGVATWFGHCIVLIQAWLYGMATVVYYYRRGYPVKINGRSSCRPAVTAAIPAEDDCIYCCSCRVSHVLNAQHRADRTKLLCVVYQEQKGLYIPL